MDKMKRYRDFFKADGWDDRASWESDQQKELPQPPFQKEISDGAELFDLPSPDSINLGKSELLKIINQRRSRRKFTDEILTLEELSYLLWITQGVQEVKPGRTLRTVPSGGARHAFETYLFINRVDSLESGIYRYLPLDHRLCLIYRDDNLVNEVNDACLGQTFVGSGAVVFFWTTIAYRAEWRYGHLSHKMIAIDSGHVCQNLYLGAESIGGGTVAIGAYSQERVDLLLKVDGEDEFCVYLAPVGKI